MDKEEDEKRYDALMEGLKEVMAGNFSIQLPRSEKRDALEALTVRFNMTAQKLYKYSSSFAHHNPKHSSLFVTNLILDLDEEFRVVGASKAIKSLLNYHLPDVENKPVQEILGERSKSNWERMVKCILKPSIEQSSQQLWFKTAHGLTVPAYCFISEREDASSNNMKYSLHAFEAMILAEVYDEYFPEEGDGRLFHINSDYNDIQLRPSEIKKMKSVEEFILNNLDTKLLSLSDLAVKFKINKNKLKRDFRWLFNCSPHQYHRETRLEKAHGLIISSDMAIKYIAHQYAFSSVAYFSRCIKEKYGLSPMDLRNSRGKRRKNSK